MQPIFLFDSHGPCIRMRRAAMWSSSFGATKDGICSHLNGTTSSMRSDSINCLRKHDRHSLDEQHHRRSTHVRNRGLDGPREAGAAFGSLMLVGSS